MQKNETMKKLYIALIFASTFAFAQDQKKALEKLEEGITLHDEGKYQDAIAKYDEALALDRNNVYALTEKALTLEASQKYSEAIEICEIILKHFQDKDSKTIYVTYGNSLDHLGKIDKAIKIYEEGIKLYPTYYQLYYNMAIALYNAKEYDRANKAFQNSIKLNPNHTSSYNALAIMEKPNRIASILLSSRYLSIDNKSARAKSNLDSVLTLMMQGVKKNNDQSINIGIDMPDNSKSKKGVENDFTTANMVLSMSAALDFDEKNQNKTDVEKFTEKFTTMVSALKEGRKKQKGYYWENIVPYFIEMKDKNMIEPYANSVFLAKKDENATQYAKKNKDKMAEFYDWSKNFKLK